MLEIRDLSAGYGHRHVLEHISLKASEGEVVGIIGSNGSGKTTLLKTITKVLEPISGTVLIDGTNVNEMQSKEIAKKVAVVSQVISINFEFTVEDIVLMGRTPYIKGSETVEDINIVRDAMEKTNTFFLKDRLITQLSGGELQRVIIARAFAQNPNILLLDEPTSHLDITNQIDILNLIKNASRKGMVVVAVIHDLNLAAYYCDKICLLQDGKLISAGSPEQVLTSSNIERAFNITVKVIPNEITNSLYVIPVLEPLHDTLH
ncbi:MAG: heme ABC transporter ATP-binding protein [ANME-2 cluster archaeon]|nr:heme ABC transporter ATP-binding protein [ANME-2 cluster archaeon]MBC2701210.1 heme ABC transporter ATP-binding protein [ANME-2 cluster archaeon]MBC2707127.1 heme ABC transporter ATP-binding protein [ANME-2 cluster archaeon]MBC2747551.1 heme ABC transporter ATP-binding protein [ANME-2 cluster archaeon]MBC2762857.1 heme ABC transporter ATP-binding protein [ANME-2 cluster archaeon]